MLPLVVSGTELTISGGPPEWKKMAEYRGRLMISEISDRMSAKNDNDGDSSTLPLPEEEDEVVSCCIIRISPCQNRALMRLNLMLGFPNCRDDRKIEDPIQLSTEN